jgi:transcriptional regulator with XRE-family HTH domain
LVPERAGKHGRVYVPGVDRVKGAATRALAGLSQVEFAELAGVHVNRIKRLECMEDRLSGMTVARIGEALQRVVS